MITVDRRVINGELPTQKFNKYLQENGYEEYYSYILVSYFGFFKKCFIDKLGSFPGHWSVYGPLEEAKRIAEKYCEIFGEDINLVHISNHYTSSYGFPG